MKQHPLQALSKHGAGGDRVIAEELLPLSACQAPIHSSLAELSRNYKLVMRGGNKHQKILIYPRAFPTVLATQKHPKVRFIPVSFSVPKGLTLVVQLPRVLDAAAVIDGCGRPCISLVNSRVCEAGTNNWTG